MRLRATMRQAGYRMADVQITVAISIYDVINAFLIHAEESEEELPSNRAVALRLVKSTFIRYGQDSWARVTPSVADEQIDRCTQRAKRLFPELAEGVDV